MVTFTSDTKVIDNMIKGTIWTLIAVMLIGHYVGLKQNALWIIFLALTVPLLIYLFKFYEFDKKIKAKYKFIWQK